MKERTVTIPQIAIFGITRIALGAGIGLLTFDCLNKDQRKGAGWVLLGLGVVSTIPLVLSVVKMGPFAERPLSLAA